MTPRGQFVFVIFFSNSVQILTCDRFFSAGPAGARALKSTLTCERRREAGDGWKGEGYGRGSGRVRDTRTLGVGSSKQVRCICPYLGFNLFLPFYFSISQVSSPCTFLPQGQTGKGVSLNVFARLSRDLVLLGSPGM